MLTNPLSEDAPALFCFSHTFFGAISPTVCSLSLSLRRCYPTAKPLPSPSPFPAWKHSVSHKPRPTWPWTKPPSCSCPQVLCQKIPAWIHPRPAALSPARHLSRGDTKEPRCHQHCQLPLPSRHSLGYSSPQNPVGSGRETGRKGRDYSREHSRDPSLPQAASQQGENFSSSVAMENATFHPEMPEGSALTSIDPQPQHCGN